MSGRERVVLAALAALMALAASPWGARHADALLVAVGALLVAGRVATRGRGR